jgi:hypothetical protein
VLLSDADRDQLLETLKLHAAAGRIEMDELERRVGIVEMADTFEQAGAAMDGLPLLPAPPAPESRRGGRRRGRHAEADRPEPGWQPTGERFRDPRSGQVMRVWVDASGGRHYVGDTGSA